MIMYEREEAKEEQSQEEGYMQSGYFLKQVGKEDM